MKKYTLIGKYYDMNSQIWIELESNIKFDGLFGNIIQFETFDELEEWVDKNNFEFFGTNYNYVVKEC